MRRQANLFLTPLDQERHWYGYHQLFADVLRVRLKETLPDVVPELYRRASAWCQRQSLGEEAMQYAWQAEQHWRLLPPAPAQHIPIILLSGHTSRLDKLRGRLCGAQAYLTKPFRPAEVLAVI